MTAVSLKNDAPTMPARWMRYRLPKEAGGGDLVMHILLAKEHDEVIEQDATSTRMATELALTAAHSIAGELVPKLSNGKVGPAAIAWFRKLSGKKRAFILNAYISLHSLTADESKFLKRSRTSTDDGVLFAVPGTAKRDPDGGVIEGSEDTFVLQELLAGQIDDTLRAAQDGRSQLDATNRLTVLSLQSYNGVQTPRASAGLAFVGNLTNKVRTAIVEAYWLVHEVGEKEATPFLAEAEPMMEPPDAI